MNFNHKKLFDRGHKKLGKSGLKNQYSTNIEIIFTSLSQGNHPPAEFYPHPLHGKMKGKFECRVIGQQWVLVYEITDGEIILHCLGSHKECDCGGGN